MSPGVVVSNASPRIALAQIQALDLLHGLFTKVCVPSAVATETAPTVLLPSWIDVKPLAGPVPASILALKLGQGESEAIALAVETNAQRIILDDLPARKAAQRLKLPVVGTLGILLAAKRRRLIPAVRPPLDALIQLGFRAGPDLRQLILLRAGEAL